MHVEMFPSSSAKNMWPMKMRFSSARSCALWKIQQTPAMILTGMSSTKGVTFWKVVETWGIKFVSTWVQNWLQKGAGPQCKWHLCLLCKHFSSSTLPYMFYECKLLPCPLVLQVDYTVYISSGWTLSTLLKIQVWVWHWRCRPHRSICSLHWR